MGRSTDKETKVERSVRTARAARPGAARAGGVLEEDAEDAAGEDPTRQAATARVAITRPLTVRDMLSVIYMGEELR